MKAFKLLLIIFLIFNFSSAFAQTINTAESKVEFSITGGGVFKIKGTLEGMKGDFKFNKNDLANSHFNICIESKSVDTKNEKRDVHISNSDFLNVDKYPNICFESTSIIQNEDGFVTKGNMTILDTTKNVEIAFTFTNNTFFGELTINRYDFNLGETYGTLRVGKEATIKIKCVIDE